MSEVAQDNPSKLLQIVRLFAGEGLTHADIEDFPEYYEYWIGEWSRSSAQPEIARQKIATQINTCIAVLNPDVPIVIKGTSRVDEWEISKIEDIGEALIEAGVQDLDVESEEEGDAFATFKIEQDNIEFSFVIEGAHWAEHTWDIEGRLISGGDLTESQQEQVFHLDPVDSDYDYDLTVSLRIYRKKPETSE